MRETPIPRISLVRFVIDYHVLQREIHCSSLCSTVQISVIIFYNFWTNGSQVWYDDWSVGLIRHIRCVPWGQSETKSIFSFPRDFHVWPSWLKWEAIDLITRRLCPFHFTYFINNKLKILALFITYFVAGVERSQQNFCHFTCFLFVGFYIHM